MGPVVKSEFDSVGQLPERACPQGRLVVAGSSPPPQGNRAGGARERAQRRRLGAGPQGLSGVLMRALFVGCLLAVTVAGVLR